MGEGRISRGQPHCRKGAEPQRSPIFGGAVLFMHNPLSQNYQIRRANTCWGGSCILGSAMPPIPTERRSSAPHFRGSPVFMFTPFNTELRNLTW